LDDERLLQIEATLPLTQQERYKNKFFENSNNFAWSYDDIPRLDPSFIMHNLPFIKGIKPIKQKPRKMHPSKALLIEKEIEKYLNASFIRPIDYSN